MEQEIWWDEVPPHTLPPPKKPGTFFNSLIKDIVPAAKSEVIGLLESYIMKNGTITLY